MYLCVSYYLSQSSMPILIIEAKTDGAVWNFAYL